MSLMYYVCTHFLPYSKCSLTILYIKFQTWYNNYCTS